MDGQSIPPCTRRLRHQAQGPDCPLEDLKQQCGTVSNGRVTFSVIHAAPVHVGGTHKYLLNK